MDPNEALRTIRDLMSRFERAQSNDEEYDIASDLIEAVDALDTWLLRGGFLPDDWQYCQKKE